MVLAALSRCGDCGGVAAVLAPFAGCELTRENVRVVHECSDEWQMAVAVMAAGRMLRVGGPG